MHFHLGLDDSTASVKGIDLLSLLFSASPELVVRQAHHPELSRRTEGGEGRGEGVEDHTRDPESREER